ncbi:MAG: phage tail protein, partial [Proteobacteria bacterium]|nr:phage tail protein [Pseudomonadota bacterium]
MATLVFTAIGTLLGGPLGGAIGALAGRQVDALILGGGKGREGPRLAELSVTTSSYGMPIPRQFGRMRVAGQIIWATDLVEHKESHGNGKGRPSTTEYTYTASFAVALSSRPIVDIGRIWADGKLLRGSAGDLKTGGTLRLHRGTGDQPPDPLLAAAEAAGRCPAYSGLAYAVFEDLQLADFGNRLPALTFEVIADSGTLSLMNLVDGVIADVDAAAPLPGVEGLSLEGALGDTLSALDPLFPVDCDACDSLLTIRPDRHQSVAIALPEAATSTEREDFGGNAGYARTRAPEADQPVAVLRYYDVDRDYQPGAQRAGGRPAPGQPRTIELPAALTAQTARNLIEGAVKRTQWARQTISWRVTQLDPAVRPGATVSLPGHPGLWRVREWEWRSHGVDLTLVRLSPAIDSTFASDPGRALPAPDQTLAPTVLAVCELPWDGNAGTATPLVLAAASSPDPGWSGAGLYVDQGDGALQPLGPSGRSRAIIGTAASALAPASSLVFDRH